ncbi:ABC transporter substrate-binding protein [Cytobacillus purgationiresistens]|uniref:Thiamine pyrimidine synthase n=1 Tax=Cytobacillus purgationiresistens TaxID=863449 RepID=A0ABU0AQH4_9BACI|nr:ABC transporter substrate-binding protein [Cytobacillus purgationiresistens]MDQ0273551.1 ABC-type nitrate/sulfonate/bicarbonate transport system substrate-binding protein [Cytobacillus purgationiresistens]
MRKIFYLAAASLFLFVLSACGGASSSGSTDGEMASVTFAEPARILSFAPLYVAIEKGYLEDEGIDAKIASGGGGSQVIATLLSGDSQFAISAPRAMLSAIEAGEDLISIQGLNSALTYEVAFSKTYMKEKGISQDSTLEDKMAALSGATIGSNQVGDSGDVYLRYLMQKYGQDQKTLETVKMDGTGSKVGAMQEGIIDGGIASAPFSSQVEAEDGGLLAFRLSDEEMYAELAWEIVFAKRDYIEDNPELAKKVVKALGKGIEFTRENPAEAAAAIISYFEGVDEDILKTSLEGLKPTYVGHGEMTQAAWDNAQDPLVELSEISGVPTKHDTTEDVLWTNSYIEEAFSK